jgi:hypothetical protein
MYRRMIVSIFTAVLSAGMANLAQLRAFAQEQEADRTKMSSLVLKEGTEVPLRFAQDLSSKNNVGGDSVHLVLAQDVVVDGVTVARAGSAATAEVTNAKKAGMMGKGGELNIRLEHLTAGSAKVRLRGSKAREGDSKVGTAVVLTVLFGPVGLMKHGKNIEIAEGTPLTGYVAEDVKLPATR